MVAQEGVILVRHIAGNLENLGLGFEFFYSYFSVFLSEEGDQIGGERKICIRFGSAKLVDRKSMKRTAEKKREKKKKKRKKEGFRLALLYNVKYSYFNF